MLRLFRSELDEQRLGKTHQQIALILLAMKAIKIPNAALLDVFGRPVSINSSDPHRPSLTTCISRAGYNELEVPLNQNGGSAKNSLTPVVVPPKVDSDSRLSVIGEFLCDFQRHVIND